MQVVAVQVDPGVGGRGHSHDRVRDALGQGAVRPPGNDTVDVGAALGHHVRPLRSKRRRVDQGNHRHLAVDSARVQSRGKRNRGLNAAVLTAMHAPGYEGRRPWLRPHPPDSGGGRWALPAPAGGSAPSCRVAEDLTPAPWLHSSAQGLLAMHALHPPARPSSPVYSGDASRRPIAAAARWHSATRIPRRRFSSARPVRWPIGPGGGRGCWRRRTARAIRTSRPPSTRKTVGRKGR